MSIQGINATDISKITSGQVIIDLRSIVKELVENAIDASAKKILVNFANYGIDSITVQDNGKGISENDFDTVCLRSHTSKIREFEDLSKLGTLGFRGEALNSICALANKVSIKTRTLDSNPICHILDFDQFGALVKNTKKRGDMSTPSGTVVTIESIFKKFPVRWKNFIKNSKKEFHKTVSFITNYLLIYPTIKFEVTNVNNGKRSLILSSRGGENNTSTENLISIFGTNGNTNLLEINLQINKDISIAGHISSYSFGLGRSTQDRQFLFVNKRPIVYKKLAKIINEIYKSFNHVQFPVYILNLDINPEAIDVNLLPDKTSVLVHNEDKVLELIRESLITFYETKDEVVIPRNTQSQYTIPSRTHSMDEASTKLDQSKRQSNINETLKAFSNDTDSSFTEIVAKDHKIMKLDSKHRDDEETEEEKEEKEGQHQQGDDDDDDDHHHHHDGGGGGTYKVIDEVINEIKAHETGFGTFHESVKSLFSLEADVELKKCSSPALSHEYASLRNPLYIEGGVPTLVSYPSIHGSNDEINNKNDNNNDDNDDNDDKNNNDDDNDNDNSVMKSTEDKEINSKASVNLKRHFDYDYTTTAATVLQSDLDSEKDSNNATCISSPFIKTDNMDSASRKRFKGIMSSYLYEKPVMQQSNSLEAEEINPADNHGKNYFPVSEEQTSENGLHIQIGDEQFVEESLAKHKQTSRKSDLFKRWEIVSSESVMSLLEERMTIFGDDANYKAQKLLINKSLDEQEIYQIKKTDFLDMKLIGQFNLGFILVCHGSNLFIIDQHASDEKFNFERLLETFAVNYQPLITPLFVDLNVIDEMLVLDHEQIFQNNGFKISVDYDKPAGAKISLTSLPVYKNIMFSVDDFYELINLINEQPSNRNIKCSKIRKIVAMKACRSSIMIGSFLSKQRMQKVVANLSKLDKPWNCPHGRPTMRHLIESNNWQSRYPDYSL